MQENEDNSSKVMGRREEDVRSSLKIFKLAETYTATATSRSHHKLPSLRICVHVRDQSPSNRIAPTTLCFSTCQVDKYSEQVPNPVEADYTTFTFELLP